MLVAALVATGKGDHEHGRVFVIEVQIVVQSSFAKRAVFYNCKCVSATTCHSVLPQQVVEFPPPLYRYATGLWIVFKPVFVRDTKLIDR